MDGYRIKMRKQKGEKTIEQKDERKREFVTIEKHLKI